jgi:hypothetical protein
MAIASYATLPGFNDQQWRTPVRWAVYFLLGVAAHHFYWKLPVDLQSLQSGRFWADIILWPFIMLWDWPKLLSYLSRDSQEGIGYLIGLIFLGVLLSGRACTLR